MPAKPHAPLHIPLAPDISVTEVLRQQFSNATPEAAAQSIRQLKRTCFDLLVENG
jgi:hypothetical protein